MAARFDGQIFTFTQPDGTPIQLRGWGDQYYAVFETLDGYTVTKNPATGYWEVARLAPDGNALEPAAKTGARLDGSARGRPERAPGPSRKRLGRGPRVGASRVGPALRAAAAGTTGAAARHSSDGCRGRSDAGATPAPDGG